MAGDASILQHYLAPVAAHLAADGVTEVVVNRPREVGVERRGLWDWREAPELTETWLMTLARAAAAHTAQDVDAQSPICSTVLPAGVRCQIVLPPAAEAPSFTLRKPSATAFDLASLERDGLFDEVAVLDQGLTATDEQLVALRDQGDWPAFFRLAVERRRNILISGATGSGKTTFAKSLVQLIPAAERILTIEDARELVVPHRNAVHLLYAKNGQGLANVDAKTLLESALRMRPDRVLLQELRDGAAFFYLRTINSGHPGSITTLHADSASLAFEQLALLVKESEAGRHLTGPDIRRLLDSRVDIVVQMERQAARFRLSEVWYDPFRKRALAA